MSSACPLPVPAREPEADEIALALAAPPGRAPGLSARTIFLHLLALAAWAGAYAFNGALSKLFTYNLLA